MALVDITMSVDGGDTLNELDLARLEEIWGRYRKLENPQKRAIHHFDAVKNRVEKALAEHVRKHDTYFVARPIHVNAAFYHDQDQYDHHLVILPQRMTWDAVNRGYDYLRVNRPPVTHMDYESNIRHWAADNLAKYLDPEEGFSRRETDQGDLFAMILLLDKAWKQADGPVISDGLTFNIATRGNRSMNREDSLYYIHHRINKKPY